MIQPESGLQRFSLKSVVLMAAVVVAIIGITFGLLNSSSHLTKQQRITYLESEVKCPSCEGVSALDSNTASAFAVKSFVSKSVNSGKSDSEILHSLESSYGTNILMSPPSSSGGILIDILPFIFVAAVVGFVGFYGVKRRRRLEDQSPPAEDLVQGTDPVQSRITSDFEDSPEQPSVVDAVNAKDASVDSSESKLIAGVKYPRSRSLRKAWPLYLGVILVIAGIGSGLMVLRNQNNATKQVATAILQAQTEAQDILKARVLANQGQDVQALKLLSTVLKSDPNQPVALAYQGWLLRQAGEKDKDAALINQGQQFLEKAVKLDPGYPDARVFLGIILFQDRHDPKAAVAQFNAFLVDKPSSSFVSATKSVMVSAYKQASEPVPTSLSG